MQTIIEKLREEAINKLFSVNGFNSCWPIWMQVINEKAPTPTPRQIINLGDGLKEIFNSTNTSTSRSQSDVAGGGANWEALVCWYLNLCLIGSNAVVLKHHKELIPEPISNAITVNYGTFKSNTESDLIAITFPDRIEYRQDKDSISIRDEDNVPVLTNVRKGYNLQQTLNALVARDFAEIEIHIIQCKTNWNDNAQIPMLWDMVYSSGGFKTDITVGREGYSINDAKRFTYSFATVPTVKIEKIKADSVAVLRVRNLSGGNYWGLPSVQGVANSMKEMLNRNFGSAFSGRIQDSLAEAIPELRPEGKYAFFHFPGKEE